MTTRKQALGMVACGVGTFVFGIIVIGVSAPSPASSNGAVAAVAKGPAPVPRHEPPSDEQRFVAAIVEARNAYRDAPNEMAKGEVRITRKQDLCTALPSFNVQNWEGTIYNLSSNNDGRGVLEITIGPRVYVKTWNNAVSDYSDGTLLSPSSAVYKTAVKLRSGQKVRFSGTLLSGDKDCAREVSLTQAGSMTEPEFIMRFTDLTLLTVE